MSETTSKKVSFKNTLNLPNTDFPIRSNHKQDDVAVLERWAKDNLSGKTFELHQGQESFILHDGPPYANGHIHLGHAYNKILKDIVTKSQRMMGKHVPVTPGWDCHGLPIELKVLQEKPGLSAREMKKACREYATKWIDVQRSEFKKLGVLMDWDHPYKTMDPEYEASILRAFGEFVRQGYIEKKNKTVSWCFSCETVLATAEIEYQDRKDPSIYVYFPLTDDSIKKAVPNLSGKPVNMLIWTTTPWTLPLNRAVFIHPKTTYDVIEHDNQYFIVGSSLSYEVCKTAGITKNVVATIASEQLADLSAHHPFVEGLTVPVLADNFVSLDDGTACVHSAPGCGPEDYEKGVRYGLEIFSPLAPDGTFTEGVMPKELEGVSIKDAQGWVIKTLAGSGRLLHKGSVRHSYPHCWRCRNGLMFRATSQWFCNLSKGNLKERALEAIETISFIPERSKNFLKATIGNRLEWCLSRQRVWGVPITALINKKTKKAFISQELIENVAKGIQKEGIEYWDNVAISDIIPQKLKSQGYSADDFEKETDILDVWFDSGVSHYTVLRNKKALSYPADMYLEGVDQHRGWFQSSLLTSLVLSQEACYRSVLTHGFTVDKNGKKMSKSLGNVVAPQDMIDKIGTDGLRLWVSSISFEGDAIVSDVLIRNVQEVYRKIRNTCRFLLSNLNDYDHAKDAVAHEKLLPIDHYAIHELARVNEDILNAYKAYDFTAVFHALGDYCARELSSFYLDIIKDRLYVEKASGHERRSAQTACYYILDTLTHLIAPILSFTSELISDEYQSDKTSSIHMQLFRSLKEYEDVYSVEWSGLKDIRSAILKAIEEKRETGEVKHSLDASVSLYLDWNDSRLKTLKLFVDRLKEKGHSFDTFLKEWSIVSRMNITSSRDGLHKTNMIGIYVGVQQADGVKCPRCWQWDTTNHEHGLCKRCERIVAT